MKKEAIVLDKIKREIKYKQTAVIQCIGNSNFSILEVISDDPVKIQDVITTENKIVRRITYNKLSSTAKKEIDRSIEAIVIVNPEKFINFFNNARPIGLRRHQLDLLPMIGKKHRLAIIEHIKSKGKFESFDDIKKIEMMPDPVKIIVNRIVDEVIDGPEVKYNLFTMPYFKKF